MKTSLFEPTATDVARYITERNAVYTLVVVLDGELRRIGKRMVYRNHYNETKTTIRYIVNGFVAENKLRMVIPERTYRVNMTYKEYSQSLTSFQFTFKQSEHIYDFPFADYKENMLATDEVIDNWVKEQVKEDIAHIFGKRVNSFQDDEKEWHLECDNEPVVTLERSYQLD